MNSSVNVSRQSLDVMMEEMASALERVRAVLARDGQGWDDVFAPSDFAVAHSRYLAVSTQWLEPGSSGVVRIASCGRALASSCDRSLHVGRPRYTSPICPSTCARSQTR
jgi:hypothetical protein